MEKNISKLGFTHTSCRVHLLIQSSLASLQPEEDHIFEQENSLTRGLHHPSHMAVSEGSPKCSNIMPLDMNIYVTRKTVALGMMGIALMTVSPIPEPNT